MLWTSHHVDEVWAAIEIWKLLKTPGINNIIAEEIQTATEGNVLLVVLEPEKIPLVWKKALTIQIHKKKDKLDCNNFTNTITNTRIDLVRRLQIERRHITMSGTLKNHKTGTVWE